ncbi:aminotransferase class V-fold PLP-dependent enzyme [Staphylococcus debuckii]|uniref:Aminotransferase class V-fold PLP-dependent enzyme n=1 Tax=Staphylococcus debuckii TaxID=2044912 RepID=A0ABU9F0Z4_9STAP
MKLPLNHQLKAFLDKTPISFHVPGHKNMTIGDLKQIDLAMDITEITDFDDLHHPEEVLKESMQQLTKHTDYEAYYLVNGTTSGILSVIQAAAQSADPILMSRNVHKSVFHGLDLSTQAAQIMPMEMSKQTKHYRAPDISEAENMMTDHSLAIVTYPNYYGETFDVQRFIQSSHKHHIPVLVDEAHGAHFGLEGFPVSSLEYQADYVVQSYHKTLPAFTMSSVIFIHKNAPYQAQVKQYLTYFQSSSPSYLLMAGLERAQAFYQNYNSTLFFKKRKILMAELRGRGFLVGEMEDPLKLTLKYPGHSGYEVQTWLEEQDIYVELADDYQTLLVLPLWHEDDTFPFELLQERIKQIELPEMPSSNYVDQENLLPTEMGHYQPLHLKSTIEVELQKAVGKRLGQHLVPYPPGIPVYFKGEEVTDTVVQNVESWIAQGIRVEGLKDNKIRIEDN